MEAPSRASGERVDAGMVAHDEAGMIRASLSAVLAQELPEGTEWGSIFVVASGCTDGTEAIVSEIAAADRRVVLIVEPDRRGKAAALAQVFSRSTAERLVLVNADAIARPGAVRALLAAAPPTPGPFAVMGRARIGDARSDRLARCLRLMWSIHDELHRVMLEDRHGNHLSDELLLVGGPGARSIPPGVLSDGAYLGQWLSAQGGRLLFAPAAEAVVDIPHSVKDHLRQRRRILAGNRQVAALLGAPVSSMPRLFLERPRTAVSVLRTANGEAEAAVWELPVLAVMEFAAWMLSVWDRLPPRKDFVRWERIRSLPLPSTRIDS